MMERQSVTREEAEAIWGAATNDVDRMYMKMLWYSAARSTELANLQADGIGPNYIIVPNLKQRKVVRDKVTGEMVKPKRGRLVERKQIPIPREIIKELLEFVAKRRWLEKPLPVNAYVFSGKNPNKPRMKNSIWDMVTKASRYAKVFKVNRYGKIVPAWPHCFRHGRAETLYRQTKDLLLVRDHLGHSSAKTTEVYTELTQAEKEQIIQQVFEDDAMEGEE